ncbi:MAG: hypothetical protein WC119_00235 [Synergistaceae bacterium]
MSNSIDQVIRDVIDKFVSDGFMFTAFDVTRTVREEVGKSTSVSHNDVKVIIQNAFNNGELGQYVRDLINVGTKVEPFVYYHPYSDIVNYDPKWILNDPKQDNMKADLSKVPSTPVNPVTPSTSGGYQPPILDLDEDDTTPVSAAPSSTAGSLAISNAIQPKNNLGKNQHRLTREGRLQIPINIVREAGFQVNQNTSVINDNGKLTIMGQAIPAVNSEIVRVNKDGRIRICHSILKSITSNPKNEVFKVERNNGEIIIETV